MKIRDMFIFAGKSLYLKDSNDNLINYFVNFCSDAKNMATDVRNILLSIIKTKGNMSESDAQQYIKKMETQKRYQADIWS